MKCIQSNNYYWKFNKMIWHENEIHLIFPAFLFYMFSVYLFSVYIFLNSIWMVLLNFNKLKTGLIKRIHKKITIYKCINILQYSSWFYYCCYCYYYIIIIISLEIMCTFYFFWSCDLKEGFTQGFRGVLKSLKFSCIKFKALKNLKLYKKVLIMITRGLKFGDRKDQSCDMA